MTKGISSHNNMNDLIEDLQFLIQEVSYLSNQVQKAFELKEKVTADQFDKIASTIDALKTRIDSQSYEAILRLNPNDKSQLPHYRSLIKLTRNLDKIGDFMIQSILQINYLESVDALDLIDLKQFFKAIDDPFEYILEAFIESDSDLAEDLCSAEEELDQIYLAHFNQLKEGLSKSAEPNDYITLLFIIRYFERIGDKLLKIGEGIINLSVGESLGIHHYVFIKEAVEEITGQKGDLDYKFKPFLFSKSGSKVGTLDVQIAPDKKARYFYKQGEHKKTQAEITTLEMWNKLIPGLAPEVKWKSQDKKHTAFIVNRLNGKDLLNFTLGKTSTSEIQQSFDTLAAQLETIWTSNFKKKKTKTKVIRQIKKREKAILKSHENFFNEPITQSSKLNFRKVIDEMEVIEKSIYSPFQVLCHGDFNLDNIFYDYRKNTIHFIDTHRSTHKDYAEDIAVFMVSALRVKVDNQNTLNKMYLICQNMFDFGHDFAITHNDNYYDVRVTIALFRSFITSTRFLHDDAWYEKLRRSAYQCYKQLNESKQDLKSFKLDLHKILD
jgi:phosphate uptake regulator/aminoglycoside phosphotransferase